MESDWLVCNRCPCGYGGDVRRDGERCGDLSWVPSAAYRRRHITVRMHQRLACKGRVHREVATARSIDVDRLRLWRIAALATVGIQAGEKDIC